MGAESYVGATAAILIALIGSVFGGAWLNRRNLARLTTAQAETEDANAAEVTDRIAREWLGDLRSEVLFHKSEAVSLEREVRIERRIRRLALEYASRLHVWAVMHVRDESPPPMPEDLAEYLET